MLAVSKKYTELCLVTVDEFCDRIAEGWEIVALAYASEVLTLSKRVDCPGSPAQKVPCSHGRESGCIAKLETKEEVAVNKITIVMGRGEDRADEGGESDRAARVRLEGELADVRIALQKLHAQGRGSARTHPCDDKPQVDDIGKDV